jgi:bromodomain-containing factor 1
VNPAPGKDPSSEPLPPASVTSAAENEVKEPAGAVVQAAPVTAPSIPVAVPATNGFTLPERDPVSESLSVVPDSQSQPQPQTNPHPQSQTELSQDDTTAATESDANLTESFIPSSVPTDPPSSSAPIEKDPSIMDVNDPQPLTAEAPISDLRTEPHADALTPEAVAQIEAQKHELDNSADQAITAKTDTPVTSSDLTPSGFAPNNIGLPSPPAQSPPAAPQPAPALLPNQESAPAPEPTLPLEQPQESALTPSNVAQPASVDQVMTDAPAPPTKQVHEREDDGEDAEPVAKRVKTDEPQASTEETQFKVPEIPAVSSPAVANGDSAPASQVPDDGNNTVTVPRLNHMKKVISNLKKSNASANFRLPVDYITLNIPTYPDIIKHPMDLGTIDHRLKRNEYTSVSAFVADFELIVSNCITFNGPDHGVSVQAKKMQSSFNGQMKNLPKAIVEEPSKEVKKAAKKTEPTRTAPPRRPSVSTSTVNVAPAGSPVSAAPSTPAFALNPDGMPLIRRDSNVTDGRPKRQIVPTKRNSEFGAGRPRKKKYEIELRFCEDTLKDLMNPKNWQANQYFMDPVDPVALNIPTYFQVIKKPMDLGTIRAKLQNNEYERAKDFEDDVRQIFKNCFKFNPEGDLVNSSGKALEDLFNRKWETKTEWIAAREPASVSQSDAEDDDEDDEESEDDGNDSEDERNEKIKKLQEQIAEMSKQMGELTQTQKTKKSKSPKAGKKKDKTKVKKEKAEVATPAGKASKDKKDTKKKASTKKAPKDRYVTFAEKQYISNGIAMLPEKQMQEALKIIQSSVPSLANSDQSEIELDIEEVPNFALLKLMNFIAKYAGPPPSEPAKTDADDSYHAPAATKNKKNRPMSKHEQEAQIQELKGKLGAYAGGPLSPNAVQSIETGDSSDDDDSDQESEEE